MGAQPPCACSLRLLDTPGGRIDNFCVVREAKTCGCLALALAVAACGQFHTQQFYQELPEEDAAPDVPGLDVPAACEVRVPIEIVTAELPAARLAAPYVAALASLPGTGVQWRVTSGSPVPGVDLDPSSGVLAGLPAEAGQFTFEVEVSPRADELPCFEPGVRELTVDVAPECQSAADCAGRPEGTSFECAAGRCVLDIGQYCPEEFLGNTLRWNAAETLLGRAEESWTVAGHEEVPRAEQSPNDPYVHRLTLHKGQEDAVLRYSLPDSWPMPFAVGDVVSFAFSPGATAVPSASAVVWAGGGGPAFLLFNGFLGQEALPLACPAPVCSVDAGSYPVSCQYEDPLVPHPPKEDQCGTPRPDAVVVEAGEALAAAQAVQSGPVPEQSTSLTVGGADFLVTVGSAYSYSTFDALQCRGTMPAWASFMLYPKDACPVAVVHHSVPGFPRSAPAPGCTLEPGFIGAEVVCYLGDAQEPLPHVYLLGTESFSPSGLSIAAWDWSLEQPVPGLSKLLNTSAPEIGAGAAPQRLMPSACGAYRVHLGVVDDQGRTSCVDDVQEVQVRPLPSLELRVELAWKPKDPGQSTHANADLLLKYPRLPMPSWQDTDWVCSPENPTTHGWAGSLGANPADVCHLSEGDMADGRVEALSVAHLVRPAVGEVLPPYAIGVRVGKKNPGPLLVTLRVYLGGSSKPVYEAVDHEVAPGLIWTPGAVSSVYMAFIANSKYDPTASP